MDDSNNENQTIKLNEDYLNQEYEELLLNLKIISLLGEREKIYTNNNVIYTQNDKSIFPESLIRWWNNEDRISNVDRIQDLVNSIGKIITDHNFINSSYKHRFHNELNNSLKGLRSLKKTYRTDTVVLAKIETITDIIVELIKEIGNKIDLNTLFNYESNESNNLDTS